MKQILCFGDSITWGSWENEGGWVDRLKRASMNKTKSNDKNRSNIYNLGICGDTTTGLVERFSHETVRRLRTDATDDIFLFAFGANDATFLQEEKIFQCPLETFEDNLRKTIQEAKSFSKNLSLLTITPVIEDAVNQSNYIRKNEYVKKYNERIHVLTESEGIGFIDIHSAFVAQNVSDLLGTDGLHPNEKGHELIFSLVNKELALF